jgi:hypothetical protein
MIAIRCLLWSLEPLIRGGGGVFSFFFLSDSLELVSHFSLLYDSLELIADSSSHNNSLLKLNLRDAAAIFLVSRTGMLR